MIVQKWKKEIGSDLNMAVVYYSLLSIVNNLELTTREIELLAFAAIRGTISSRSSKIEFCRQFSSSVDTVNNIISKLKRLGYLVKTESKITVTPQLNINFSSDLLINLHLHGIERPDN